eukprot:6207104-Pleurochrysis_carterae.AAC.3
MFLQRAHAAQQGVCLAQPRTPRYARHTAPCHSTAKHRTLRSAPTMGQCLGTEAIARRFLDLVIAREWEQVEAMLADDVSFTINDGPGFYGCFNVMNALRVFENLSISTKTAWQTPFTDQTGRSVCVHGVLEHTLSDGSISMQACSHLVCLNSRGKIKEWQMDADFSSIRDTNSRT